MELLQFQGLLSSKQQIKKAFLRKTIWKIRFPTFWKLFDQNLTINDASYEPFFEMTDWGIQTLVLGGNKKMSKVIFIYFSGGVQ